MKNARQKKILEIIKEYRISTQEELIERLNECGFSVTQTTVSRDINQLKLIKTITPDGEYKYILPSIDSSGVAPRISSAITDAVVKIDIAKNIIVIKTLSGMANAVAVCVDSFNHNDIVGSVAGDDTILLVIKTDEEAEAVMKRLNAVFFA